MKSKSSKTKGSRFERYLTDTFRETIDEDAHRQPASGAGLDKNDVRLPAFNTEIEAKNAKKYLLGDWWEQTKSQQTTGNKAMLAVRNPKKPEFEETLVVMELNDFIELLGQTKEEVRVIENKDKDLLYWSKRLKEACGKVIKKLEK